MVATNGSPERLRDERRGIIGSGREVCGPDIDPVGMQRPVIQMLDPTECLFSDLGGLLLVSRIDFHYALADLALATVFAKYVFQEPNNKPRHGNLLAVMVAPE